MSESLDHFERIVRTVSAGVLSPSSAKGGSNEQNDFHPFETRNIHPDLPGKVRSLFDDGHWEQSVFEAFKYLEVQVKIISGEQVKTGYKLMMDVFNEQHPRIPLNLGESETDKTEQRGYQMIFAGASAGIRNPRGHEVDVGDTPDEALDYLALASLLLRKLDAAGVR